jgi:hypothetical protein
MRISLALTLGAETGVGRTEEREEKITEIIVKFEE